MSEITARLHSWDDLTLKDMVFAYRKAKADCFFERAISLARQFGEYELALEENLASLLQRLRSDARNELARDGSLLGQIHLVVKKLGVEPKVRKSQPSTHAFFSDPARGFARLKLTHALTAEFRIAGSLPVNLHVLSALWVNRVGHRLDACLGPWAYGSRLRRYGDDGAPNSKAYHIRSIGSMTPYFLPYRRWREDGLLAIERALHAHQKIIAITLDIRNYFHRIDPRFILDKEFHKAIGLGTEDQAKNETQRTGMTPVELELTTLLVRILETWGDRTAAIIRSRLEEKDSNPSISIVGGIPIAVTACRLMANVLLHEWDRQVLACLSPVYYGRYVDDMFLVLRDPGTVEAPGELMTWIAKRLPRGMLRKRSHGERHIVLWPYQGNTELVMQDGKHRVFFLQGPAGHDLLRVIRREIVDLSSERRLMPDPETLTQSPAARVLTASGDVRENADSLRRAEGLSIRRMGWAILLRGAETLALDLPAEEWRTNRSEFYRFAKDYVLRPECLLDHVDYLPRLLGLAVGCQDWGDAVSLYDCAHSALRELRATCGQAGNGLKLNGYRVSPENESTWDEVFTGFEHLAQEAVVTSWPWTAGPDGAQPEPIVEPSAELLRRVKVNKSGLHTIVTCLYESDLARTSLREHRRHCGLSQASTTLGGNLAQVESCFGGDVDVIRDFLDSTRQHRIRSSGQDGRELSETLLPYLFPTRPFTPREIAELDPRCVDLGTEPLGAKRSAEHWGKQVRALRGIWTRADLSRIVEIPREDERDPRVVSIGARPRREGPRLCIANLKTDVSSWHASADDRPVLSLQRYRQLVRLVNLILKAKPRPHYLLLPELSLPRRWATSVVNRLLQSRISVVAGVEYVHPASGCVRSDALLALTDDRLGFDSSVLIWQHKSAPAPHEEEELLRKHGKHWCMSRELSLLPVYHHQGFEFGVLICSELQRMGFREAFQGQVDCLMILSWNKDLESFAALVESAALDVHTYVALVNNRLYGDSRVRCPAKEQYKRDLCRIRGGEDDYAVIVQLDVEELRRFQSRAKNWPRDNDFFKPVPQGFVIAERRRMIPE